MLEESSKEGGTTHRDHFLSLFASFKSRDNIIITIKANGDILVLKRSLRNVEVGVLCVVHCCQVHGLQGGRTQDLCEVHGSLDLVDALILESRTAIALHNRLGLLQSMNLLA